MQFPTITMILGGLFIAYILHSMYALAQLFTSLECTGTPCFHSYLRSEPKLQLMLFTSVTKNPINSEVSEVAAFRNFNFKTELNRELNVELPLKTRRNGTLFMHVVLADDNGPLEWKRLQRDGPTVIQRVLLTDYMVPRAQAFNLVGEEKPSNSKSRRKSSPKPVTHFKSKVFVTILTDAVSMSVQDIPPEMAKHVRVNRKNEFLPIIQNDFLKTRLADLEEVSQDTTHMKLHFNYAPISVGKLRLLLHVEIALQTLQRLGFAKKDVDEVKGIFSDTNVYLLCGTIFVGSVHVLFDFLSFKNDVSFWRQKQSYAGLSVRTTLWRAFSQIVIFLFLLDEHTSLLVLIPAGIGMLIELWKCKKILRVDVSLSGIRFRPTEDSESVQKAENLTKMVDRQAMKYLSYVLYPLCIGGAIYSLIYQPHKSWYSWTLNSVVNGVYAFGFLFMLPQLFINYKLKSVAALPWRAFMYKAFNTFIDDIFAFIITMPTANRLACFRDDIVFLIYLYQRWLYPVDATRLDDGRGIGETIGESSDALLKGDDILASSIDNNDQKTEKKTN